MAHFAGLVAAGLHPEPGAALRLRHLDDAQDARRPALRLRPLPRGARDRRSTAPSFPGMQGGPLSHVIAAKATCFRIAATRRLPRVPAAGARERRRAGRRAPGGRPRRPHRRHRHAPAPARPARDRVDGQGRRGAAGTRSRITANRNTVPFDERPPTVASGVRIGTPACDDARLRRGRLPRGRADHRRRARRRTRTSPALARAQRRALLRAASALPRLPRLHDLRAYDDVRRSASSPSSTHPLVQHKLTLLRDRTRRPPTSASSSTS